MLPGMLVRLRRASSRARALLVAVLAAALVLSGLLVAASPVAADVDQAAAEWESPTADLDCAGPTECLVFAAPYDDPDDGRVQFPTDVAWELVPIPETAFEGLSGYYQLRRMGTDDCLTGNEEAGLYECQDASDGLSFLQAWYFEPVGEGTDRVVDADAWKPWSRFDAGTDEFYLRKLPLDGISDGHCVVPASADAMPYGTCGPDSALTLHDNVDPFDPGHKSEGQMATAQERILGAAFARGASTCEFAATEQDQDVCKVRAVDRETGALLSDWNRIDEVVLDRAPTAAVSGRGCTGGVDGAGAQAIYNGGSESVSTTISTSTTSEVSESVSTGFSFESEFGWGKDSKLFSASIKFILSVEYGRTWTESRTISQDISWEVPPHRYTTAVLASEAVNMTTSWQFGPDGANPWRTDGAVDISLPYSSNASAAVPDSTLAVYNSWGRKNCDATAPSTLADGQAIGVTNSTSPGSAPIVGDVLAAEVEPTREGADAWWSVPAVSDEAPVNLRYQWYRVRSGEPADPIPGARGRTYTVTGDDVTDPEVLDRFGPYHLYLGVTDVADETRFDSREYTSVGTGSVTEGPRRAPEGHLSLSVANPDAVAIQDTRLDLAASITGGDGAVDGPVTILDGGDEIAQVRLGSDGTKRVWLPLTTGAHDLVARYDGDGPLAGVQSSTERTTIAAAPSTTSLVASATAKVGDEITLRASVAGAGGTPTGTVEFFDGPESLGAPVGLTDGVAVTTVPGLAGDGVRELWASYGGDSVYASSASPSVTQTVGVRQTETSLAVTPMAATLGDPVTLTARVSSPDGTVPRGSVRFEHAGGGALGDPVTLVDGAASLVVDDLGTTGEIGVTASFAGAAGYADSQAGSTLSVAPASSATRLRLPDLSTAIGQRVRLWSRATSPAGSVAGTIAFYADGRRLGRRAVDERGVAVLRTTDLPRGKVRIWTRFLPSPDSSAAGSRSVTGTHQVRRFASKVRGRVRDTTVRKRERVVVRGRVVVPDRPRLRLRGKIWLDVDGTRHDVQRVGRDGRYRVRVSARRLDRGRNVVTVVYRGSKRPSVAADAKRVVVRRR